MDFPSPASAVHSKSGEEGSPDQQLCRIPLWTQATSSQLGPSAQSGATQIKAVTGRFPQSETRPNLTVTRHLEAGIHLVVAGRGALGGLARGTVGSIGVP